MQVKISERILAAIMSLIFPGIGHFYFGQIGRGIAFVMLALAGWWLTLTIIGAIFGIPILLATYIGASVQAFHIPTLTFINISLGKSGDS